MKCLCIPADYYRCPESECTNASAVRSRLGLDEDADEIEHRKCARCEASVPLETIEDYGEDFGLCPECAIAWRKHFAECPHEWEPGVDEYGDPGQVCSRCAGFVNDEDFEAVIGAASSG